MLTTLDVSNTSNIDEPLLMRNAQYVMSARVIANSGGNIIETYKYQAYGQLMIQDAYGSVLNASAIGNGFLFDLGIYDGESGSYINGRRYYDPIAGRFRSKDPLGFSGSGPNLYAYVHDNPILYEDPLGFSGSSRPSDYWGVNLSFPIPELGIVGGSISVYIDASGNLYIAPGLTAGVPSVSASAFKGYVNVTYQDVVYNIQDAPPLSFQNQRPANRTETGNFLQGFSASFSYGCGIGNTKTTGALQGRQPVNSTQPGYYTPQIGGQVSYGIKIANGAGN